MPRPDFSSYGPWVIVTGASAGIGHEFVNQLAESGLNVVLVARRGDMMRTFADLLRKNHGIETRVVSADLTDSDAPARIAEAVSDLDVGLLVNNAGTAVPETLGASNGDTQTRLIDLNFRAPVALTHELLDRLRSRERSGVIFVSSVMGYAPSPYLGTYGGTKSAIRHYGHVLGRELKSDGVDVLVLSPGGVKTELATKIAGDATVGMMEVGPVVRAALSSLGRKAEVIPGAMNKVMGFISGHVLTAKGGANLFGRFSEMMLGDALKPKPELADAR